ncbi:MAG: dockerin type I domain-containing protein [Ruminococcus sp.]|nr:dockerin type I domain-containing protein [Ruminococcus sp.]
MAGKFKRCLAGVLALMLSASTANLSILYVSATDFIEELNAEIGSGDINEDGYVNSDDVGMIKELLGSTAGSISSSEYSLYDVYKDDIIDVRDLMAVKQLADGKIPEKPENESSGKTVKLEVKDADCCPGEQVTVDVNILTGIRI